MKFKIGTPVILDNTLLFFFNSLFYIYLFTLGGGMHTEACVEIRDSLCELAPFFCHVGFRDSAQADRPCGNCRQILFLSNTSPLLHSH